ncbi:MAG: hypothetical protein IJX59_07845 [Clostridia bacterium]|nr:hypothetical protein [Clostridia bacterium]
MKRYLKHTGKYFIGILGGLFVAMLLVLAVSFLSRFFFEKGSAAEVALSALVMASGFFGNLFAVAFQNGYKSAEPQGKSIIFSVLAACFVQVAVCVPFSFAIYAAGPAYPLGELLYRAVNGCSSPFGTPDLYVFLCMLPIIPLCVGVALIGEHLGAKKRKKEREKLHLCDHN